MKFRLTMQIEYSDNADEKAVRQCLAAFVNFAAGSGALCEGLEDVEVKEVGVALDRVDAPEPEPSEADAHNDTGLHLVPDDEETHSDLIGTCQQCYEDFTAMERGTRFCSAICENEYDRQLTAEDDDMDGGCQFDGGGE